MLAGLGALKSKIKVVSKLETDCDQTKGAAAAQTILTANKNLTASYSACGPPALGAIQSIKNAGIKPGAIILVGFDASTDEVKAIKGGTETASVAQFPASSPFAGLTVPDEVKVNRQVLAEPSADLGNHTWAALADGTPLVTQATRGAGRIGLERLAKRGERELTAVTFAEDAERRQRSHEPIQRGRVGPGGTGELIGGLRSIGEAAGEIELRRHVDDA